MPSELHEPAARHESGCSVTACPIGQPALPGRSTGRDGRLGGSVFIVGKWRRMGIGSNRRGPPAIRAGPRSKGPIPTSSAATNGRGVFQRVPDKASIDRAAGQAADSQERVAWVKLIQALASGLGITGLLPAVARVHRGAGQPGHADPRPSGARPDRRGGDGGRRRARLGTVRRRGRGSTARQLQVDKPFFTVIIVPRLFPDNVAEQGRLGAEDRRRPGEDRAEEVPRTPRQGRRSGADHRRQERQGSEPPVPGTRRRPGRGQTR